MLSCGPAAGPRRTVARLESTRDAGYDFIEVPLLAPSTVDVEMTRKHLECEVERTSSGSIPAGIKDFEATNEDLDGVVAVDNRFRRQVGTSPRSARAPSPEPPLRSAARGHHTIIALSTGWP
jgi:hypothetical protein